MLTFEKVVKPSESSFTCYLRRGSSFPFEWHYHPEYELVAVISGKGQRFVGDDVGEYQSGDLVLTGPDLPHTWKSIDNSSHEQDAVVVQFSSNFLGEGLFDHIEFTSIARMLEMSGRGLQFGGVKAAKITDKVRALVEATGLERVLELFSILNALTRVEDVRILSSEGFVPSRNRRENDRINRAFNYIYEHSGETIRQDDVAAHVNMSRAGFSRFFRRCAGRTFIDCLNDIKLGHACRLLIDTDHTVTEICYLAGFKNLSNFNRQFLKFRKLSPRKYRLIRRGCLSNPNIP